MFRKILATAGGIAILIGSGVAMARDSNHAVGNEKHTVHHGAEYGTVDGKLAREGVRNSRSGSHTAPYSQGDWEYLGGDAGWQLRQHGYDFGNGRLLHSDNFAHNTPKPELEADSETYFSSGHSTRPR